MGLKFGTTAVAVGALLVVTGCQGGGMAGGPGGPGAPGGTLPVSGSGKMLAVRLPGTATSSTNTFTNTPQVDTTVTGVAVLDRTAAGGVGVSGSIDEDPDPNPNQGSDIAPAVLVTATADDTMAGGATIVGLTDVKGNIYFENGNFGDPQVESATAAISSVGVYNPSSGGQIVLENATTIRYRDGIEGDGALNYGVGYVGNLTQNMPGSGTATYRGFYEHGIGVYEAGDGSIKQFFMSGDANLTANFAAGTVTGGVTGDLESYDAASATVVNLNQDVTGLEIDASIAGSEYAGSAAFVDAGGQTVGTYNNNEAIGGFFGNNAAETAAAVSMDGNMELDGGPRDFVFQGVIGAVKQ